MNLNFIAELTADPGSAKVSLKNRATFQANPPVCYTCGQEMSGAKIEISDANVWRCPKAKKNSTRRWSLLKNRGIKEQDLINLVFIWSQKTVYSKTFHGNRHRFLGQHF